MPTASKAELITAGIAAGRGHGQHHQRQHRRQPQAAQGKPEEGHRADDQDHPRQGTCPNAPSSCGARQARTAIAAPSAIIIPLNTVGK